MVLMGYRGPEKSHDTIASELVDGAFVAVYLVHEDVEAAVHDLVDFLGIELLRHRSEVGHVGEEHGDQLALTLEGLAVAENLVRQELGGVSLGLRVVYRRR